MSVHVDCYDRVSQKVPKTKIVEGRLRETLSNLAVTEGNSLYLFTTLKRLGLSTNDVSSFVDNQSLHKRILKGVDNRVRKTMMQSKINDAIVFAKRLRQEKNVLKHRILRKYPENKCRARSIVKDLLQKYRSSKAQEYAKADKKIEFYKSKSTVDKSLKEFPRSTSEFLNGINIFNPDF